MPTTTQPASGPVTTLPATRLAGRVAPLSGAVFVALLTAGISILGGSPQTDASAGAISSYYSSHQGTVTTSVILLTLASIVGLFFFHTLRQTTGTTLEGRGLGDLAFAGAILFALAGVLTAGCLAALTDMPTGTDAAAVQALSLLQNDLDQSVEAAGIAVLFLAFGAAILRGRALPAALGWAAILIGVAAATVVLTMFAFMAAGLWIVATSMILAIRPARRT